jgi:hypothetical protein
VVGTDVKFMDKDADAYVAVARQYAADGDPLAELTALEIAHAFSKTAPFIDRAQNYVIAAKIKELVTDSKKFSGVRRWKVDGHEYDIHEVTVETTRTGIRPRIVYATRYKLDAPEGEAEARALVAYVSQNYTAMHKMFSSVVFEAVVADAKQAGGGVRSKRHLETLIP